MFTGIIETTTEITQRTNTSLTVLKPYFFDDIHKGMSIAVNGACLSVIDWDEKEMKFDVLSETFRKTNLQEVFFVNLERAMPANGRFEGHIVLGHVDKTILFLEKKEENSGTEYVFQKESQEFLNEKNEQYILKKGSISINGVSLTIGNITNTTFSVFLIPTTLNQTTFGSLKEGEKVNIEYDYLTKIIIASSQNTMRSIF